MGIAEATQEVRIEEGEKEMRWEVQGWLREDLGSKKNGKRKEMSKSQEDS